MKEIKSLRVSQSKESQTIYVFQSFGWVLVSSQDVYAKDTHLERRGESLYSVTETINYVKLNFERDSANMKHYQQIRQLESAFYAIPEPQKPKIPTRMHQIELSILMAVLCIIAMLIDFMKGLSLLLLFGVLAYALYRYNQKRLDTWKAAYQKCWSKREQILSQTKTYL